MEAVRLKVTLALATHCSYRFHSFLQYLPHIVVRFVCGIKRSLTFLKSEITLCPNKLLDDVSYRGFVVF